MDIGDSGDGGVQREFNEESERFESLCGKFRGYPTGGGFQAEDHGSPTYLMGSSMMDLLIRSIWMSRALLG